MNLLQALAALPPTQTVYRYIDDAGDIGFTWTAGELTAAARELAGALNVQGERVVLCAGPGPDQILGLFAIWAAGATAVPMYPTEEPEAFKAITEGCGASTVLVGTEELPPELQAALHGSRIVSVTERGTSTQRECHEDAVILYTSGSTSAPKGVVIQHRALWNNLSALVSSAKDGSFDRMCTWLPEAHISGLYTRLLTVAAGTDTVVMLPSQFRRNPGLWLKTVERYQATCSAAPDFAYALLASMKIDVDLSCWKVMVSGGERVQATTLDAFTAQYGTTGWAPYFGMTETLCTSIPLGDNGPCRLLTSTAALAHGRVSPPRDPEDVTELVGNGEPLGDTVVRIVHPEKLFVCEPGHIGEVWVGGTAVTSGYLGAKEVNETMVRARLPDGEGPFLRTGDLGFLHEGQLFITGRIKEVLIVRGKNHHPPDIEATITRAVPGVVPAAFTVLQDGDEALGLAIEVGESVDAAELLRTIRRDIAQVHGLAIAEVFLVGAGVLPRTKSNKLSRASIADLALSGVWKQESAHTLKRKAVATQVASLGDLEGDALVAALIENLPELSPLDRPIEELGLDSIALAMLAQRIREMTGKEPPFEALFDGGTGRALLERIAAGQAQPAGPAGWRKPVRRVAASLPNVLGPRQHADGGVFLTGATGFLGRYLLAALLERPNVRVRCLVRARDDEHAKQRLLDALAKGPGAVNSEVEARIEGIAGDVTLERFGLSEVRWNELRTQTSVVVHNAANVDFVAPYSRLAPVNVGSAERVIAFCVGPTSIPVHVVSTLAVFNAALRREQRVVRGIDRLLKPDSLYSGYAQTKWVSEAVFRAAGSRGLPVGIHRPGLITGAYESGVSAPEDFLCRLIAGCIQMGHYPDADVDFDLMAVDDVAASIAAAAFLPVRDIDTVMWSYNQPFGFVEVMELFRERGHQLEPESVQDWLGRIRRGLPADNRLFAVHPFLLELPAGAEETIFERMDGLPLLVDTTEADEIRAHAGLPQRPVDAATMNRMAEWLEAHGGMR